MSMDFGGQTSNGQTVWPEYELNIGNSTAYHIAGALGLNGNFDFEGGFSANAEDVRKRCSDYLKDHSQGRSNDSAEYLYQKIFNLRVVANELINKGCVTIYCA